MPAVIYARFSSDMQREESIEAQIRACKYYAQQEGIDILRIYTDRAKSGMYHAEKRSQFNKMMKDAALGEFDTVLVHKLNRFGRAGVKALNDREHFERFGVEIISVTERLENTPEGRLMLFVITGMNEYYSRNLATEVLKGMRENAYKGLSTGGVPALGYEWEASGGKLIINELEASAVRLIFEMYARGTGYNSIIDELNMRGYATKRGNKFGKNSIYDILRNERYTGVFTYEKTKTRNGKKNQHRKEKDYIRIEGGCPQIIENDLWDRVQKMMDIRKRTSASNKAKALYTLTGKVFCGHCGHRLCGTSKVTRGQRYLYYACNTKENGKKCELPIISKSKLENAVYEKLNKVAFSEEYINRMAKQMYESYEAPDAESSKLQSELNAVEKKLKNIANAIASGAEFDELHQTMQELKNQKTALQERLLVINEKPDVLLDMKELKDYLRNFCDIKNLPEESKREVIRLYVDKITVFWNPDGGKWRVDVQLNPNNIDMSSVHIDGFGSPAP
ncbi:MAG: recombinase family protein [Oscillospiraceae bacterium]